MLDSLSLFSLRAFAAFLAAVAVMATPIVATAQCGIEGPPSSFIGPSLDENADDQPENERTQQQECAHGHCLSVVGTFGSTRGLD